MWPSLYIEIHVLNSSTITAIHIVMKIMSNTLKNCVLYGRQYEMSRTVNSSTTAANASNLEYPNIDNDKYKATRIIR